MEKPITWRPGTAWIKRRFKYTMEKLLDIGEPVDIRRILREAKAAAWPKED